MVLSALTVPWCDLLFFAVGSQRPSDVTHCTTFTALRDPFSLTKQQVFCMAYCVCAYIYIYIYMHACCRRGILANPEGEYWPSRPSRCRTEHFLRGNPGQNQVLRTQGVFWPGFPPCGDQIPPYGFLSRKRLLQHLPIRSQTSIFIVVSCNKGPFRKPPPKIARKASSRQFYYSRSVLRGGFLYILHFFLACNFCCPLFATLADGGSWNPLFCSVFVLFVFSKFLSGRSAPGRRFCWPRAFFEFSPQKRGKIENTGGK